MTDQSQPPVTPVQAQPTTQTPLKPHRGVIVLVLGILGIVVCVICGIIAWVMGKNDLREIDAGLMDPAGRGLTQAGKICGMISVILALVGLAIWLVMVLFIGGAAVVSQ
ncbi:MAG: DUF4190 domain-containing protein [Planctomycetota bacterium]|jgi:hypothetical protein